MKALIIMASLSLPVMANETCNNVAEFAEVVQKANQERVAMSKLIGAVQDDTSKRIIVDAYNEPRFSGAEWQNKAIADFRDKWYLACIKSFM